MTDKSTTQHSQRAQDSGIQPTRNSAHSTDVFAVWRSLTLQVSCAPENIKLHTERLLFALDNELNEYIAGALHDLFICLQEKGLPLRQRMFNLLSPLMVQSERNYFHRWLSEGSDKKLNCIHFAGGVFKSDTCQAENPTEPGIKVSEPTFKSRLSEARYNIENGQITKAQAILEDLCLQQETGHEANLELQTLFQLTRQKQALAGFIERYTEQGKSLPDNWQVLYEQSESW